MTGRLDCLCIIYKLVGGFRQLTLAPLLLREGRSLGVEREGKRMGLKEESWDCNSPPAPS